MDQADSRQASAEPTAARPLGRDDWIEQGLGLLARDGVEAVMITRLAEGLGVTRGSFYWHFKDRDDLLTAVIDRWERRNSRAVIATIAAHDDLTGGILALFDLWRRNSQHSPGLDPAIRDWARHAEAVRRTVEAADRSCLEAIAEMFERDGYESVEAFIRARIIYFTQVGYYALEIEETLVQRFGYLEPYFEGFTGRKLDPKAAKAFRARFLDSAPRSTDKTRES